MGGCHNTSIRAVPQCLLTSTPITSHSIGLYVQGSDGIFIMGSHGSSVTGIKAPRCHGLSMLPNATFRGSNSSGLLNSCEFTIGEVGLVCGTNDQGPPNLCDCVETCFNHNSNSVPTLSLENGIPCPGNFVSGPNYFIMCNMCWSFSCEHVPVTRLRAGKLSLHTHRSRL